MVIAISMQLLFVQKSLADEFDDLLAEYKSLLETPPRKHCDSNNRPYELKIEWLGDKWVAKQRYCYEEGAICAFLDGEDPKKYCLNKI